ncbi:MAG: tetratricopeptide repeat protein [Planctomycetes bacterium]|nr:tetratricopeptide repeat protein [Planctomycetota bacterium]
MLKLAKNLLATIRRRPVRSCLIMAVLAGASYVACRQALVWRQYFEACRAGERGDFAAAWEALQPCLAAWPGSASTQFLAARTARRAGDLQEAQTHLARAQQLAAPAEDVILERYLLRAMSGELADVEPKLIAFLDKEHPDSVLILEVLTQQRMNDFRLEEARALLDRWLLLKPNEAEAYVRLGWIDDRLGNISAAVAHYQKAVELSPERDNRDGDRVRLRLTELLLDLTQASEAQPHLQILRERRPDDPAVALADIRYRSLVGKSQEAAALLDTLMRAQPGNARLLLERARMHMGSAEPEKAEPLLRQAVALSPRDRQVIYLLTQCLKTLKKKEADIYEARSKEIRNDEQKMRELMQELLRAPKDAWLHYRIGEIFLRNGFQRDGERSLLTAVRLDPEHSQAHRALAAYYEKSGQPELAVMHRRAAGKGTP